MPAWDVEDARASATIIVEPSAPAELFWYILACEKRRLYRAAPGLSDDAAVAEEARGFWRDGFSAFSELLVLAHSGGLLLAPTLDELFARLDSLVTQAPTELRLASEQPDEASAIRARLTRLRQDSRARRAYTDLLRRAWAPVEPIWRSLGLPATQRAASAMRDRLTRGASLRDVLPSSHMLLHYRVDELLPLVSAAQETGRLAISPGYLFGTGGHLLDLPGLVHVGVRAEDEDPRQQLLTMADAVARRAKVLSDTSRVAILAELAQRPSSITELAQRFELSQPTVSMHVKILREAELLRARKTGTRTTYAVDRDKLEAVLQHMHVSLLPNSKTSDLNP